ncbi:hypothetical protein [Paracoccus sp. (in: a-proteobacteria)]|uniref:hypothetical protein n=1 Tax=Paracoccus sp. TaxID=267 RepID=UPI003A88C397
MAAVFLMLWASCAATADCADLLSDTELPHTTDRQRYEQLVACQTEALVAKIVDTQDQTRRCAVAFDIVSRLDLSSFASSLGPLLTGPTRMADLGPVTISHECRQIDFGDAEWTRRLDLVAVSSEAAVARLTDKAAKSDYDRPGVLHIQAMFYGDLRARNYCEVALRSVDLNYSACP